MCSSCIPGKPSSKWIIRSGMTVALRFIFYPKDRLWLPNTTSTTNSGANPGCFLGGDALISCSTSTPINHIVFLQNTSCIRKPQVISVGVLTPCPLPLDPPLKLEKEVKPLSHHKNVNKADKQKFFCYDWNMTRARPTRSIRLLQTERTSEDRLLNKRRSSYATN